MPATPLLWLAALGVASIAPPTPSPSDPAGPGGPTIAAEVGDDVITFRVEHPTQVFVGAVLASPSPELAHYLVALPPLLAAPVLLGGGVGYPDGGVAVAVDRAALPLGVPFYVQGVTFTEAVEASGVLTFALHAPAVARRGS